MPTEITQKSTARLEALRALKAIQTNETKHRILASALELFNECGIDHVTTHQIAHATSISPGNLYYHFKNKEEIIRQLFRQIDLYSQDKWFERGPANPKNSIIDFMRFFFGCFVRYRFFFREFSKLLKNDPLLAKEWQNAYQNIFKSMQIAVRRWHEAGILKAFSSQEEADMFIENSWVILNFAAIFIEASEPIAPQATHEKSVRLFLKFLYPYHTQKGQKALDLWL